mmetsp:Transcript_3730/g.5514  ORF Transcript_3730/g.5514 Transcript_3730/m.5514 type:complete len:497 (+) Transcript_3730:115-1605(+)
MSNYKRKVAEKYQSDPKKTNTLVNLVDDDTTDSDVSELGTLLTDMSFSDEEDISVENTVPKGKVNKSVVSKLHERFFTRKKQKQSEVKEELPPIEDRYLLHLPRPIIPTILFLSVLFIFIVCALAWFEHGYYNEGYFKVLSREALYTTPFHFIRTTNKLIWTHLNGNITDGAIFENRRLCPSENINITLNCAKTHLVNATFSGFYTQTGIVITESFLKSQQKLKVTTFLVFGIPFIFFIIGSMLLLIAMWLEEVFPKRDWWFSLSSCFKWRYLSYRQKLDKSRLENYQGSWINLNYGEKLLLVKTFSEEIETDVANVDEIWLMDTIQYDYQPPLQRTFRIFGWNIIQMSTLFVVLALAIIALNIYFIIVKITIMIQILTNLIVFYILAFLAGLVVHTLLQQWTIRYFITGSRLVVVNWDLLGYHIQYMWFAKVKRIDTHLLSKAKDAGSILLNGRIMFQYVENLSHVKRMIHERLTLLGRIERDEVEADLDSDFED